MHRRCCGRVTVVSGAVLLPDGSIVTGGLIRHSQPPLPLWNVSRVEYIELSRDVHDAYVESSIAQAKSIEPLSSVGNGIDPHRFAKCAQDRTVP